MCFRPLRCLWHPRVRFGHRGAGPGRCSGPGARTAGRDWRQSEVKATDARWSVAGNAWRIETGHSQPWPGVRLAAPQGPWDLSAYQRIALRVKNPGTQPVTVHCRVDNPGADGKDNCVTGRVEVKPGETRDLHVPLDRRLPETLRTRLFGMRGYPGGFREQGGIDPARVVALTLFVAKPKQDHVWEVSEIRATGTRPADLPEDLERFFPMIDRYGQYRHKDWPGKIAADGDFPQRERAEAADLSSHPGPAEWNRYGGWAAGPQLEASGRFRVALWQDKWWLVDPEGRLFWSHGIDCVRSATGATPITDRLHLFADLPARDATWSPFYGRASWAPHGYYQGKPYETFNFTGANLLRKYGADWQTRFAELAHRRLRSWGLNTIANWSDPEIYGRRKTPYVATVSFSSQPIEGSSGYWGKFPDPFDPSFRRALDKAVAAQQGPGRRRSVVPGLLCRQRTRLGRRHVAGAGRAGLAARASRQGRLPGRPAGEVRRRSTS